MGVIVGDEFKVANSIKVMGYGPKLPRRYRLDLAAPRRKESSRAVCAPAKAKIMNGLFLMDK